jgi:hypothetical protein
MGEKKLGGPPCPPGDQFFSFCLKKLMDGWGAERRVNGAQTWERGPPSAPAKIIQDFFCQTLQFNISISECTVLFILAMSYCGAVMQWINKGVSNPLLQVISQLSAVSCHK